MPNQISEVEELKRLFDLARSERDDVGESFYREKLRAVLQKHDPTALSLSFPRKPILSEEKGGMSTMLNLKIAPTNAYRHTATDSGNPSCPHCMGSSVLIGEMFLKGNPRPVYNCVSCNRSYSELPSDVKIIIDALPDELTSGSSVGFQARTVQPMAVQTVNNDSALLSADLHETNSKLDQVVSYLSVMTSTIKDLACRVQNLAQQNQTLMDTLANDPLVHIRKTVSEFNLR